MKIEFKMKHYCYIKYKDKSSKRIKSKTHKLQFITESNNNELT